MNKLNEFEEMFFELIDIEEIEDNGYSNTYDISVTGSHTFLLGNGIVSHNSAKNAIFPGLGRNGFAYYELKGKPLNAYSSPTQKFTQNKELSELYKIIQSENFNKIAIATDADLDGDSIAGLLLAFFYKYIPSLLDNGKVFRLNTPVGVELKNKVPMKWVYNLEDMNTLNGDIKYMKGLGSWTPKQLKEVIKIDGIDNMLKKFILDENYKETIDLWYNGDRADDRKNKILDNNFSIIKI